MERNKKSVAADLEEQYREILPDFDAKKLPPEQMKFRHFRSLKKIETVTTYGAYEDPI